MARALRRDLCAAMMVVPDPANASSTISPRREQSLMASITSAVGFTVGCISSSASRPERKVFTCIVPDVGSITTVLAELDHVEMRCGPGLVDKHELVLGAVERAHPPVILVPDTDILEFGVDPACCVDDLCHVPPVHADEVQGAIGAEGCQMAKDGPEKVLEFSGGHFAGRHLELPVLDRTKPAHVTVDRNVIGRVGKDHPRTLIRQQIRIGCGITGVAAEQAVVTEVPEVAEP